MTATRRLAAIPAADVAGYSRLMGADEEGTLERLKALRRELVDPKIAEHRGRIVKTTGDGLLVEFPSVVDAVRCAVAVQQAMPERNAGVAADTRIELRIMRPASRSAKFSALIEEVRFAADLYGAFPVKRLFLGFAHSSLFGAGKAVLRPVACDQVPGARGRGQGTETLAQLGGVPP